MEQELEKIITYSLMRCRAYLTCHSDEWIKEPLNRNDLGILVGRIIEVFELRATRDKDMNKAKGKG